MKPALKRDIALQPLALVYLDAELFSSLDSMAGEIVASVARALKGELGEINREFQR